MLADAGLIVFYKYGSTVLNIFDRDLNRLAISGERETSRSFEIGRSPSSNSEMFELTICMVFFLAKTSMLRMILKHPPK